MLSAKSTPHTAGLSAPCQKVFGHLWAEDVSKRVRAAPLPVPDELHGDAETGVGWLDNTIGANSAEQAWEIRPGAPGT